MIKKLTVERIGLIVAIVSGIYIPMAIHNNWFPFGEKEIVKDDSAKLEDNDRAKLPDITLQDIIIKDEGGDFTVIDLKVLNEGSQTAILTKASIELEKIWKLNSPNMMIYNVLASSADYKMKLDLTKPSTSHVKISQSIRESEPDRFSFILTHDAPRRDDYVVQATLRLVYNGNKNLEVPHMGFVVGKLGMKSHYLSPSPQVITMAEEFKTIAQKGPGLERLISEILKEN